MRIKKKTFSWAKCLSDRPKSLDTSKDLDAWQYNGFPGLSYTAKDQCEILLRDHDAYEFVKNDFSQVCENLHCRTPNRPGFFFAGPALPGTTCGNGRWCDGGLCEPRKELIASTSTTNRPKQTNELCKTECLQYGKGVQKTQSHNEFDTVIATVCDDINICKTRRTVEDYGTQKCTEFSKKVAEIDGMI